MRKLQMVIGTVTLTAELFDTPTADALYEAAPFTATALTWGEEVYFQTPVSVAREKDARDVMNRGELAFWTDGDAIAIGYGRTPVSRNGEIRLASAANVFGRALEDVRALKSVAAGAAIAVKRIA